MASQQTEKRAEAPVTTDAPGVSQPRPATVAAAPELFRWHRYDERDGLPSRYGAWSVHEDRRGLLWFATNGGGVARFDGWMWRVFTPHNSGLTHATVTAGCILGRTDGTVWFGTGGWHATGGGVSIYHPESEMWTAFRAGEWGLRHDIVTAMAEDQEGRLWFGAPDGSVSVYLPERARWWSPAGGANPIGHRISSILPAADGWLWFTTFGGGVWRLDPAGERWEEVRPREEDVDLQAVIHLCERGDGTFWFSTMGHGVCVLDPRSGGWRAYTHENSDLSSRDNRCYTIRELRDGRMAIGLNHSGVDLYDPAADTWQNFRVANSGLANDTVSDILERADETLWFCSLTGGVSVYDPGRWRTFTTQNSSLPHDTAHAIHRDLNDRLWFGTSGGVAVYDARTRRWSRPGGADDTPVGALAETPDGRIWTAAGTAEEQAGGVAVYDADSERWERFDAASTPAFRDEHGRPADVVYSICPARDGSVWLGGGSRFEEDRPARAWRWDAATEQWSAFLPGGNDAVPAARYAILQQRSGPSGTLWFATAHHGDQPAPILALDPEIGRWETHLPPTVEFPVTAYRAIREDSEGTLWFASYEGMLAFDGREWRRYHVGNSGLASNSAWGVCETRLGNRRAHWFATHSGVSVYDGETWETLTTEDGLAGTACFAACAGSDGALWFATPTGVSRYLPRRDVPETYVISAQGRVHWRDAGGNERRLEQWDDARSTEERHPRLRLGPHTLTVSSGPSPMEVIYRNQIRLQFFAADAWRKEPDGSFRYSCRIDGGPWTPYRRDTSFHFRNLSNGEHTVEVRAKNRWLVTDPTPARYAFRVDLLSEQLERERVRRDLEIGRQIQSQILATADVHTGPFATAARIQPSREVGGDFYRVFPLAPGGTERGREGERERRKGALDMAVGSSTLSSLPLSLSSSLPPARLGITLGDASGKGVPGALYMAVTVTLIQAHARRLESPAAVLEAVNDELHPQMRGQGGPRMFVTAVYGALDTEARTLTFACAGHTPPLLVPNQGAPRYLRHPALPLGALAHAHYEDQTLQFAPGDTLLLMSDGFVEAQRAGAAEPIEMFGYDRIRAVAEAGAADALPALIERIFRAVGEYARANARRDDLTLLALRCTA